MGELKFCIPKPEGATIELLDSSPLNTTMGLLVNSYNINSKQIKPSSHLRAPNHFRHKFLSNFFKILPGR